MGSPAMTRPSRPVTVSAVASASRVASSTASTTAAKNGSRCSSSRWAVVRTGSFRPRGIRIPVENATKISPDPW